MWADMFLKLRIENEMAVLIEIYFQFCKGLNRSSDTVN